MGNWKTVKEIKAEILAEKDIIKRSEARVLYLRSLLARKQYTTSKVEEYIQRTLYVSDIEHVKFEDIISTNNKRFIAQIRHIYCYHLYYDMQIPIEKIGAALGRHHASVLNGREKIKMELKVFDDVKKYYHSILEASSTVKKQGFKIDDL